MGANHMSQNDIKCQVDEYAFMLTELNLYLDTHPCDERALEKFCKYQQLYHEATEEYAARYGSLTANHSDAQGEWIWATTPWPWQKGCE